MVDLSNTRKRAAQDDGGQDKKRRTTEGVIAQYNTPAGTSGWPTTMQQPTGEHVDDQRSIREALPEQMPASQIPLSTLQARTQSRPPSGNRTVPQDTIADGHVDRQPFEAFLEAEPGNFIPIKDYSQRVLQYHRDKAILQDFRLQRHKLDEKIDELSSLTEQDLLTLEPDRRKWKPLLPTAEGFSIPKNLKESLNANAFNHVMGKAQLPHATANRPDDHTPQTLVKKQNGRGYSALDKLPEDLARGRKEIAFDDAYAREPGGALRSLREHMRDGNSPELDANTLAGLGMSKADYNKIKVISELQLEDLDFSDGLSDDDSDDRSSTARQDSRPGTRHQTPEAARAEIRSQERSRSPRDGSRDID